MIDEIFDREYQSVRAHANDGLMANLAELGRAIGQAFKVLNRIEYQAPWASPAKPARCN